MVRIVLVRPIFEHFFQPRQSPHFLLAVLLPIHWHFERSISTKMKEMTSSNNLPFHQYLICFLSALTICLSIYRSSSILPAIYPTASTSAASFAFYHSLPLIDWH